MTGVTWLDCGRIHKNTDATHTMETMTTKAILVLADGSVFTGVSIGADGETVGEVVFNTAMTGYQEIVTDPSYSGQIVTLTYPHIGNTGTNEEDWESAHVAAAGLIVRDVPTQHSSFRAEESLSEYLHRNNTVAIADIDTRRLTRIIRSSGAQAGAILTGDDATVDRALELARSFGSMAGKDLVHDVTTSEAYDFSQGEWQLGIGYPSISDTDNQPYHIVAYDFGTKKNILRMLASRGCHVHVVPATTPAEDVIAMEPDGVFLSNGPGDPEPCTYAIEAIQELLASGIPLFGICLGHQLLSLALGGRTRKMPFGHHGTNHPVKDHRSGRVLITSQNHGFDVDPDSLPEAVRITHTSLFDGSVQGIELIDKPVFSFQGHPEASPGPHDLSELFDQFASNVYAYHRTQVNSSASPRETK